MKKCRITVLKRNLDEELANEYGVKGLGKCSMHREGQVYYADWIEKPGVAVCSCNDGLRPVIFKIERTDEEATIN